VVEAHAPASTDKGERLLKGYMVSSVNEWGAEQTRILLVRRVCVCVCVRACVRAAGACACRRRGIDGIFRRSSSANASARQTHADSAYTHALQLTDEGIHRVKYNFGTDDVLKHHTGVCACVRAQRANADEGR